MSERIQVARLIGSILLVIGLVALSIVFVLFFQSTINQMGIPEDLVIPPGAAIVLWIVFGGIFAIGIYLLIRGIHRLIILKKGIYFSIRALLSGWIFITIAILFLNAFNLI